MPTHQSIEVMGYVGKVNHRTTTDNTPVLTFSVSTDNGYRDRQTQQWVEQDSTWHKVTKWNPSKADKRIAKGDLVLVIGKAIIDTWITEDHETRADLVVKPYRIMRLNSKAMRDYDNAQWQDTAYDNAPPPPAPATYAAPPAAPAAEMGNPVW